MNIPFRTAALLIPVAAAMLFGSPAAAETVSKQVSYADLDLSRPDGVATLERRIRQVAKQLCRYDHRAAYEAPYARKCLVGAMASTRPQLALATAEARQRMASAQGKADVATSQ